MKFLLSTTSTEIFKGMLLHIYVSILTIRCTFVMNHSTTASPYLNRQQQRIPVDNKALIFYEYNL